MNLPRLQTLLDYVCFIFVFLNVRCNSLCLYVVLFILSHDIWFQLVARLRSLIMPSRGTAAFICQKSSARYVIIVLAEQ